MHYEYDGNPGLGELIAECANEKGVGKYRQDRTAGRYIRLIYLKNRGQPAAVISPPHQEILNAMLARDADTAAQAMRKHIGRRREDAADAVRIAYSQLYVPDLGDFNESGL